MFHAPGTGRWAVAAAPAAVFVVAALAVVAPARPIAAQSSDACGEVVTLAGGDGTATTYSLAGSLAGPADGAGGVLVLLPGGSGFVDLDAAGCPRRLKGNSLIRSRPLFHADGFITALVDAPSDRQQKDGLGGFRVAARHADDVGGVIADVRRRTGLPVWLVGTSRGTISAANAAARLTGPPAPDGLVLTSPLTSGREGGQKAWVAQTVFSVRLEAITIPVLIVAHAADTCIRTPPGLAATITPRTKAVRQRAVTVTGGPGAGPERGVKACKGRSPHGFIGQEADVVAIIADFVRGGG